MTGPELQRQLAESIREAQDFAAKCRQDAELLLATEAELCGIIARLKESLASLERFTREHKAETDAADWWKET